MYVAITGDIVNSKDLDKNQRDFVFSEIRKGFSTISQEAEFVFPPEFLRGDSFQCVFKEIGKTLQMTLLFKSIFKMQASDLKNNSLVKDSKPRKNWRSYKNLDIRLSAGIGDIEYLKDSISLSDGTALHRSGRNLDKMKQKSQKTIITTGDEALNRELEVELKLLDAITDKWTPMSAEVVFYLLQQKKETEIAPILSISQSAVNQRKQTANWDAISLLLKHFEYLAQTHLLK
ncbi:hypothetical protein [Carboxylicivirga caseinilyticus]|uniref:hypothetical protein n=1 Tax=Carboxylicivirga caseinilyticus TaxID=3417572 RepID=UPI003D3266EB|nr:hypothetical protein [Marinilabiliaceae bacterium A049]